MDAYLVFGTYHLFQSINLKMQENRDIEGDIYILDTFQGATELSARLKETKLFDNVHFVEQSCIFGNKLIPMSKYFSTSVRGTAKSILYNIFNHNLFLSDRVYKDTPLYGKSYDRLFTFGNYIYLDRFCLYHCIKKRAKNYCVENGLGTRIRNTSIDGEKSIKRRKLGFGTYRSTISGTYMCSPLNTLFYNERNIIDQIKPICLNEEQISIYKYIYNYDESKDFVKHNDYIYIGSAASKLDYVSEEFRKCGIGEEDTIKTTKEILKGKNLYIKPHPNNIGVKNSQINQENNNVPIELLLLLNSLENKVLIALYSNILYAPKLLFNEEPYIIFIYKLIDMNVEKVIKMPESEFNESIKIILSNAYEDKNKIFIPKNKEEYIKILENLKSKIEKRRE